MEELAKGPGCLMKRGRDRRRGGPALGGPSPPPSQRGPTSRPIREAAAPCLPGSGFSKAAKFSKTSRDNSDIPTESPLERRHFIAHKTLSPSLTCLSLTVFYPVGVSLTPAFTG